MVKVGYSLQESMVMIWMIIMVGQLHVYSEQEDQDINSCNSISVNHSMYKESHVYKVAKYIIAKVWTVMLTCRVNFSWYQRQVYWSMLGGFNLLSLFLDHSVYLRVWEQEYFGILYSPQLKGSEAKWSNPQILDLPHQTWENVLQELLKI